MTWFFNTIFKINFKIKHKLHTATRSAPPPPLQGKVQGMYLIPGLLLHSPRHTVLTYSNASDSQYLCMPTTTIPVMI